MDDPRLDETHLETPRRERYVGARDEVLGSMGPTTGDVERTFRARRLPFGYVPAPAAFALRDVRAGRLHLLRVGINTVGRSRTNDIVLTDHCVSRRHCVILVHASGRCELQDTASLNGVRLDHEPVVQAELVPGDILRVCDYKFMLLAEPTRASAAPLEGGHDTGGCDVTGAG